MRAVFVMECTLFHKVSIMLILVVLRFEDENYINHIIITTIMYYVTE